MPYKDRAAQRDYQRRWKAELRRQWLAEHGPCRGCSSWLDLEVHHRDRLTKVSHRVWTWSAARRAEELAKCAVLCSECHDELHGAEMRKPHGTISGYTEGCRCAGCREAHRVRAADYRERKKSTDL